MTPREFAVSVVKQLQAAGYQALFAGGCVRDALLDREPKDYDVATEARPEQIRELFGKKRTLPIGAAFGVITVLGPKGSDPIEVATFRRDGDYSDGRRPDAVEFTDAKEDALRRDFTINGMFFDPIQEQVLDYVGGQDDLEAKQIRAIGNPHERIEEDKLRMLRGIRFAATYGFELESETFAAINQHAHEISVVSEERIGAELVRMLSHENKTKAASLLKDSTLLHEVLPARWKSPDEFDDQIWLARLEQLDVLESNEFACSIAVLLQDYFDTEQQIKNCSSELQAAWKLNNRVRDEIAWIVKHRQELRLADSKRWSEIQPLLIHPTARLAVEVEEAIGGASKGLEFCRERLQLAQEELDPPAFLTGQDLIKLGIRPGPQFKGLLQKVRDMQLDGEITSVEEAKQLIQQEMD